MGLIARAKRLRVIPRPRKTKVRGAEEDPTRERRYGAKEGGTQEGGSRFQVFVESAGAGAINLAGISELMNVIKIQPPAS